MFLRVGISEVGMLRGYVQRVTTDGVSMLLGNWSFWTSAPLFSIIFAGFHASNPGENKFGYVMVFIDEFNLCITVWRTGDLWFAIGSHPGPADWAESVLFGTPTAALTAARSHESSISGSTGWRRH